MLGSMTVPDGYSLEIVCVVDGSTDGTLQMLEQDFPSVHVVKGSGNWWYTRSMNEGFRYAVKALSPDFVLTLNDDIALKNNYLKALLEAYQQVGRDCLMGSVSLSLESPHVITFSGTRAEDKFPYSWKPYITFMSVVEPATLQGVKPSRELPGRGILIPVKILTELNYFDEDFPQYHSDFDFCLRAAKKKYPIYVSYQAILYSHVMKTSNSSTYKKITTVKFLKNLFNPYSRKHIGQNARYVWRHKPKYLFPYFYSKWFLLVMINHVKVNIIK